MVRKAMISAMDEAVGEIVTRLKKSEDWEKTVILFLSDNGSSVLSGNSPFRGGRGSPLEGGVRVPALVASPLLAEEVRGQTLSHMVHITDLAPTLLSLAGLEEITEMDGYNIWPALNNLISTERNLMVYNLDMDDQSANFQFAVRQDNWKIIWGHPEDFGVHKTPKINEVRLYDLDIDPAESNDLSEEEPEKVSELKELILSLLVEMKPAYNPNRLSLAFPRYNSGLVRTGWCRAGWEEILWRFPTHWDTVLQSVLQGGYQDYTEYTEYY